MRRPGLSAILDTSSPDATIAASLGAGMYLDLKDIGPEGLSFEGEVVVPESERYPGERVHPQATRLALRVFPGRRGLELLGDFSTDVEIACGRCLERFVLRLETPLALRLVPEVETEEGSPPPERPAEEDDEAETWSVRGQRLDLEGLAAEFVLLNLPLKPVCRESCLGLCPGCGANRNEERCECDPGGPDLRLAPLVEFRKRRGSS